jgi:hypothetical protein
VRQFWLLSVELVVFDSKEQFVSSCLHLESLSVEEMLAGSWHGLEALPSSSVCLSQHNSYRPQTLRFIEKFTAPHAEIIGLETKEIQH